MTPQALLGVLLLAGAVGGCLIYAEHRDTYGQTSAGTLLLRVIGYGLGALLALRALSWVFP